MRRLFLAAALCFAAAGVPAGAEPTPGIGALSTDNVEHVLTVPVDADIAGGRLVGRDFFLRTAKGITVYDASNPSLPVPKGFVALPATPNQEREDVDTNGSVLIAGQSYTGLFHVVDVRNRTTPTVLGTSFEGGNHTNTCLLNCTWSYGSEGSIMDLRDPTAPTLRGNWLTGLGIRGSHDLTEVKPGFLVVASNPVVYLDARNPLKPRRLATGLLPDDRYTHGMAWPRKGADRFVLGGSESFYGCTSPEDGTFFVMDTKRRWVKTGDLTLKPGLPTSGQSSVNELCGHWFDPHPSFRDGGLVAMAWYGFGVRFLEVTKAGTVKERGWWTPAAGQTSSVYWVSPDTVWALDYTGRGIDVLRFDAKAPAGSAPTTTWRASRPDDLERAQRRGRGPEHVAEHHTQTFTLSAIAQSYVCRV